MHGLRDTGVRRIPRQWLLRVAGSAVVLGVILWVLPSGEVWGAIRKIPLALWLAVLGAFLLGHVVAAAKWWLLAARDSGVPFAAALRAHFAGLVANLCLPGVAGGDVVRAGLVLRGSEHKTRIAVGSLGDRLLDSIGLLLLSCAGVLFSIEGRDWWSGPLPRIGLLLLVVLTAAWALAVVLPKLPARGMVEKVAVAVAEFRRRPDRLAVCLALSLAVQSVFVGLNVALAAASGVGAPAAAWFFAWPLAKLLAIVPVSIAGLGVREAGLAALLSPFGANPATAVAVGLIWQTVLFAGGLVGGLALVLSGRLARPAAAGGARDGLRPRDLARRDP